MVKDEAVVLQSDGKLDPITRAAGPMVSLLFIAVVVGVLDDAEAAALVRSRRSN